MYKRQREVRGLEREVGTEDQPLGERQRRNVGLVLFTSQAVQVLTVTLMVFVFFVVFGLFAVTPGVRESWLGTSDANVILNLTVFDGDYELTVELIKVAAALAAFSGLYFAVAMLTDSTYREEFLVEVTEELQQTFRDRVEYLRLREPSS